MAQRSLSDAVVAVIGAAGGLGEPVARLLAERGARLMLAGPTPDKLAALGIEGAEIVAADLRDPAAGEAVVATAQQAHGRLDGVVNAAGIVAFGPLTDTDDAVIEELFFIDVIGPLWLAKRVVPALTESKGFLVNISAVVAEIPTAGMVAYSAAKAALAAAGSGLTKELRRSGVSVLDVRPPHTETGLADRPVAGTAPTLGEGLSPDEVARRIVTAIESGEREVAAADF